MLEIIEQLVEKMADKSNSLRVAFNEEDATKDHDPEAQKFLKVNESRLGRDFEIYAIMAKVGGEPSATCSLLKELVLPLKDVEPKSYTAGLEYLKEQGPMFEDKQAEWEQIVDSFKL